MKAILVIDIADDVVDAYEDFTVDYDLRGTPKDDQKVNESIKYVENCHLKPMLKRMENMFDALGDSPLKELQQLYCAGYNKCIEELEKCSTN